jgi:hypothetical protein
MTYEEALHWAGGTQVRLAAVLGITQPSVSVWHGIIPPQYQYELEVLSEGALRADPLLRLTTEQDALRRA